MRIFKVKRGDRLVTTGPFIAPLPEGTKVYELDPVENDIEMSVPHVRVTLDGARDPEAMAFFIPEEDVEEQV
jgi:hypothetical protein